MSLAVGKEELNPLSSYSRRSIGQEGTGKEIAGIGGRREAAFRSRLRAKMDRSSAALLMTYGAG